MKPTEVRDVVYALENLAIYMRYRHGQRMEISDLDPDPKAVLLLNAVTNHIDGLRSAWEQPR